MIEQRFVVTDRLWEMLKPLLPGKPTNSGAAEKDNRLFSGGGVVAGAHRLALARFAGSVRKLEQHVPAVSPLGEIGSFRESFQRHV